jgi:hypothetical protein
VLIKLMRLGVPVREVPVHHYPRLHGEASGTKPGVILDTVREMLAFRLCGGRGRGGLSGAESGPVFRPPPAFGRWPRRPGRCRSR